MSDDTKREEELSDDMPYSAGHELDGVSKPLPLDKREEEVRRDAEMKRIEDSIDKVRDAARDILKMIRVRTKDTDEEDIIEHLTCYLVEFKHDALRRDREDRDPLEAALVRLGEEFIEAPEDKQRWEWDSVSGRLCLFIDDKPKSPREAVRKAVEEMQKDKEGEE